MRLKFTVLSAAICILTLSGCSNAENPSTNPRPILIDVTNKTDKAIPMAEIRNSISIFADDVELASVYFDYSIHNDNEHPFEGPEDRFIRPNASKRIEIDPKYISNRVMYNHIESIRNISECEVKTLLDGNFTVMIDACECMGISAHSKSDTNPTKVFLIKRNHVKPTLDAFKKKEHSDWIRRHPNAGA